jgi:hypothetical protein
VLAYKKGECPTMYGANQNCNATVLANQHTYLTAEICDDDVDNDGNGLSDM